MSSISKKQQAIIYIICSAFFFALMNMFVRMSGDLPSIQKSFFRNLVAFFFALDFPFRKKICLPLLADHFSARWVFSAISMRWII